MEKEDRERLVRVEEGVKSMRMDFREFSKILHKHIDEDDDFHIHTAKSLTAIKSKVSILGVIGGSLIGLMSYLKSK